MLGFPSDFFASVMSIELLVDDFATAGVLLKLHKTTDRSDDNFLTDF